MVIGGYLCAVVDPIEPGCNIDHSFDGRIQFLTEGQGALCAIAWPGKF